MAHPWRLTPSSSLPLSRKWRIGTISSPISLPFLCISFAPHCGPKTEHPTRPNRSALFPSLQLLRGLILFLVWGRHGHHERSGGYVHHHLGLLHHVMAAIDMDGRNDAPAQLMTRMMIWSNLRGGKLMQNASHSILPTPFLSSLSTFALPSPLSSSLAVEREHHDLVSACVRVCVCVCWAHCSRGFLCVFVFCLILTCEEAKSCLG